MFALSLLPKCIALEEAGGAQRDKKEGGFFLVPCADPKMALKSNNPTLRRLLQINKITLSRQGVFFYFFFLLLNKFLH